MRNFADLLCESIEKKNNPTVMGLDPKLDYIPAFIREKNDGIYSNPEESAGASILEFNKALIDAVYDIIPAVKPQFAYYEMYGIYGLKALKETIAYAQSKGMLVIADAKRNDIGTTATAYANSIIGRTSYSEDLSIPMYDCDCVTVNGYLGSDGINPFLDVCKADGKGIFALVRTSNPSAGELQDLELKDGRKVYEAMADMVNEWGKDLVGESGFSSVGAVVGATWPEQAVDARKRMPASLILVPGYGAQGAGPDAAVASFTADGKGSIVNASRSLMCAWKKREDLKPEEFAKATRDEAVDMRDKLNNALKNRKYI